MEKNPLVSTSSPSNLLVGIAGRYVDVYRTNSEALQQLRASRQQKLLQCIDALDKIKKDEKKTTTGDDDDEEEVKNTDEEKKRITTTTITTTTYKSRLKTVTESALDWLVEHSSKDELIDLLTIRDTEDEYWIPPIDLVSSWDLLLEDNSSLFMELDSVRLLILRRILACFVCSDEQWLRILTRLHYSSLEISNKHRVQIETKLDSIYPDEDESEEEHLLIMWRAYLRRTTKKYQLKEMEEQRPVSMYKAMSILISGWKSAFVPETTHMPPYMVRFFQQFVRVQCVTSSPSFSSSSSSLSSSSSSTFCYSSLPTPSVRVRPTTVLVLLASILSGKKETTTPTNTTTTTPTVSRDGKENELDGLSSFSTLSPLPSSSSSSSSSSSLQPVLNVKLDTWKDELPFARQHEAVEQMHQLVMQRLTEYCSQPVTRRGSQRVGTSCIRLSQPSRLLQRLWNLESSDDDVYQLEIGNILIEYGLPELDARSIALQVRKRVETKRYRDYDDDGTLQYQYMDRGQSFQLWVWSLRCQVQLCKRVLSKKKSSSSSATTKRKQQRDEERRRTNILLVEADILHEKDVLPRHRIVMSAFRAHVRSMFRTQREIPLLTTCPACAYRDCPYQNYFHHERTSTGASLCPSCCAHTKEEIARRVAFLSSSSASSLSSSVSSSSSSSISLKRKR